jgi:inorganic pyrophosphatase
MHHTMNKTQVDQVEAYDAKEKNWRVVIETPKGSHNKFKYDEELHLFVLSTVLPEGMVFPYDFGFLPHTRGDDGDPLDVLLLMDAAAFCGCVVLSRPIGVIEGEQTEDGECERNDRLVFVPIKCRTYSDCKGLKDLNKDRLEEIEQFFVSYNRVRGKKFKVLRLRGPKTAEDLARQGMKAAKNSKGRGKKSGKPG